MIYHVLRDGSIVENIDGKIVRVEDAEAVYNLIDTINGSSAEPKKVPEVRV